MFWSITSFAQSTEDSASGGGDGKGLFEIGAIVGLGLPSGIPDADEVYPGFGPHIALHTSFATLEAGAFLGIAKDNDSDDLGSTLVNQVLYIPADMRFNFQSKIVPGYTTLGLHGIYYHTHDAAGSNSYGATGGINFGGGIMFRNKQLNSRLDLRFLVNPGVTALLSLYAFIDI